MSSRFYIINHRNHPWGDYGDILSQGMAHRGDGGVLEIERTGPFVPPITLPGIGEIVVTEEVRQSLAQSGLKGFAFETVVKRLIVRSEWNAWDPAADEPAEHPESGEPEDYVLGQPHSIEADEQMGNLWALELNRDAQTHREQRIVQHRREIKLVTNTWKGQDIFGAKGVGFIYVTESAKAWFEQKAPGQLTFEEAAVTAAV
jgi:hypothetical protein